MSYIAPQAKLFEHLERLKELRDNKATSAPINVEIDLSNRCSLGCQWCHFAYTHTRGPLKGKREKPAGAVPGGDLMETPLALEIIAELAVAGVKSVTWTGGGEPTLHPDFNRIIGAASLTGMAQGLYTHGGHIDEERAALLKRTMRFVYVSLDAADAESYKRDKGVDRFEAACDGIRRLVAAEGDATIGVGYLVTRDNWQNAGRAARLVRNLAADYIQFRPTIQYDQKHPGRIAESTSWIYKALPFLKQTASVFQNVEVDFDRFRMYRDWAEHGYKTCGWSTLQTAITPNGKVWACVNKREHAAAELGDLTQDSFADIWARHTACPVNESCRLMCRGHLANLALEEITAEHSHPEFV